MQVPSVIDGYIGLLKTRPLEVPAGLGFNFHRLGVRTV
jgi:hypothetical protein